MARTYKRDANGRFAGGSGGSSGGGGGGKRGAKARQVDSPKRPSRQAGTPPPKRKGLIPQRQAVSAAKQKLAAKQADATVSARSKAAQKGAVTKAQNKLAAAKQRGTIKLAGRNETIRPGANRKSKAITPEVMTSTSGSNRLPASQRPGSMAHTLGTTLRQLAHADAQRIREIENMTGMKVQPSGGTRGGTDSGRRVRSAAQSGSVHRTIGTALRELAQSDARTARDMQQIARDATPKLPGRGSGGGKRVRGSRRKALPGS